MHAVEAEARSLAAGIRQGAGALPAVVALAVCPPATALAAIRDALTGSEIAWGGQDCHSESQGAYTGDIAAAMLADLGCRYVIVGHSERRQYHGETDATVRAKAEAAQAAGLTPIICVGESRAEREAGQAETVVGRQFTGSCPDTGGSGFVLAYEPVWAIGTGLTPSIDDIAAMHRFIAKELGDKTTVLYGGSVKPANAGEILAVDAVGGALVGGASLKAEDFLAIAAAAA